jgi:hypothetical protein
MAVHFGRYRSLARFDTSHGCQSRWSGHEHSLGRLSHQQPPQGARYLHQHCCRRCLRRCGRPCCNMEPPNRGIGMDTFVTKNVFSRLKRVSECGSHQQRHSASVHGLSDHPAHYGRLCVIGSGNLVTDVYTELYGGHLRSCWCLSANRSGTQVGFGVLHVTAWRILSHCVSRFVDLQDCTSTCP